MSTCGYEYSGGSVDFKCLELVHNRDATRCIFHDIDYLKGDNYEKNKKEIANRFNRKLSKYHCNNIPLEFMGYYLSDVSFQNKQFAEGLYFNEATFSGLADFKSAKFFKKAYFNSATFSERANFGKAIFFKKAYFNSATFFKEAVFYSATFSKEADFREVTFKGKVDFDKAEFSNLFGRASFSDVKFHNEATFSDVKFHNEATFSGAIFHEIAKFIQSNFYNDVNFIQTTFNNIADFTSASGTNFSNSKFVSEASYLDTVFNSETLFNNTISKEPIGVIFDSNLSKVSFKNSDISRIRFSDKVRWDGEDGFTIIEEKWLIDKLNNKPIEKRNNEGQSISPELVLSVYRNLRENYEFRLRYGDAGKFFIKDIEKLLQHLLFSNVN